MMRKQDGFTVVEMLIVVTVIGILSVIVLNVVQSVTVRARGTRVANSFQQIEKSFYLKATDDGISEWWAESDFYACAGRDGGNARLQGMIDNCGFQPYLQNLVEDEDIENYTYDADSNTFAGCGSTLHAGVNIAIHDELPYELFLEVDRVFDDPNDPDPNRCGKVRWGSSNSRIFFLIESETGAFRAG